MAVQKKRLSCGHVGRGQYCQRCRATGVEEQVRQQRTMERAASQAKFVTATVDLHALPDRDLVREARDVLAGIGAGMPCPESGGKRLSCDRAIISAPLDRDYRILFRDDDDRPTPLAVMSHEA